MIRRICLVDGLPGFPGNNSANISYPISSGTFSSREGSSLPTTLAKVS
jgi:hypothetical protein